MITLEKVDGATLEAEAEKAGITLPIEQTKVWSGFRNGYRRTHTMGQLSDQA